MPSAPIVEIPREAQRLEEDALYAEKQHFSMATVWSRIHFMLGIPATIAAALAGVTVINEQVAVAVGLSITSAVLTALLTFLNPEKAATAHHAAGVRYSELRGRARRLHLIDGGIHQEGQLRETLELLWLEKTRIMEAAPHVGGLAYRLAKASIGRKEHRHAVDR